VASIAKCAIQAGDDVVVIGAGTMGLLHMQLALAASATPIVVEPDARRRGFALEQGAAASLPPGPDCGPQVKSLTGGRGAAAVIVAVGTAAAIESAFDFVAPGGTVMLFAGTWPQAMLTLDPNRIHYGQLNVTGSVGGLLVDFEQALALMAAGSVQVEPLITARFPLQAIMQAHQAHEAATGYKVLVLP
jgi:L-iditol 2-dehydrogenase